MSKVTTSSPSEFCALANIIIALTRPSVAQQFLLDLTNYLKILYRSPFNTYATSLRRLTLGKLVKERAYPQDTSWPKGRNSIFQDVQSLGLWTHLSDRCSAL